LFFVLFAKNTFVASFLLFRENLNTALLKAESHSGQAK